MLEALIVELARHVRAPFLSQHVRDFPAELQAVPQPVEDSEQERVAVARPEFPTRKEVVVHGPAGLGARRLGSIPDLLHRKLEMSEDPSRPKGLFEAQAVSGRRNTDVWVEEEPTLSQRSISPNPCDPVEGEATEWSFLLEVARH